MTSSTRRRGELAGQLWNRSKTPLLGRASLSLTLGAGFRPGRGRQAGGDAVEHAVQAELEAFLPGVRVVRVDAGLHQPGDVRVPAGVLEPAAEALVLGLDLLG